MQFWLLIGCVLVVVGSANAAEYWPRAEDSTYHYRSANGETMVVDCVTNGANIELIARWYQPTGTLSMTSSAQFAVDLSGDVILSGCSYLSAGGDTSGSEFFEPPITFLDLPLAIGRVWQSTAWVTINGPGFWCTRIGFVDRSETVTVPYGTFETLVVEQMNYTGGTCCVGTYYLHPELGAVILPGGFELVS